GEFALPFSVLPNNDALLVAIAAICRDKNIGLIVLGESKNFAGEDNPIMKNIREFKIRLEKETGLFVHFEPEFFTSVEAGRIQGKNAKLDASAAALILKSFLEKRNYKKDGKNKF
ncbi:MAG: RuvX/YqgF family protein, partial [Patescibacteria group bacterium]